MPQNGYKHNFPNTNSITWKRKGETNGSGNFKKQETVNKM